jgi:hypothetical protein
MNPKPDMTPHIAPMRFQLTPGHVASRLVRVAHRGIVLPEREGVGER